MTKQETTVKNEIEVVGPGADLAPAPAQPMTMLERALASNQPIEVLSRLMDLEDRNEQRHARRAFDTAIAAAKSEMPTVVKNRKGHNDKRYADFAAIAKAVDPIITAHGLSYRFRISQADKITVTCVLSHEAGHAEETTLSGPADTSGAKNAIQSIGSTLSYLQRYSLVAALGLAIAEDDDGEGAGNGGTITNEQADELRILADEVKADLGKFAAYMKVPSIHAIPAKDFDRAKAALEAKRVRS